MRVQPKHSEPKRQCVLVLGMHRSGTSAVCRLLNMAGATLPSSMVDATIGNELGHWEPKRIVRLNDRTFAKLGRSWCDWRDLDWEQEPGLTKRYDGEFRSLLSKEFNDSRLFVVKDPRLCMFADRVIPAMANAGITVSTILPIRNPVDVCASLSKRDAMNPADAALLWLRHTLLAERATRGRPRAVVSYEQLVLDWRTEFQRLTNTAEIIWPNSIGGIANEVDQFLTPDHRHHNAGSDALLSNPLTNGWLQRTYEAMMALAHDPLSEQAESELDSVAEGFRSALPFLEGLYVRIPEDQRGLAAIQKPDKVPKPFLARVSTEFRRWRRRIS